MERIEFDITIDNKSKRVTCGYPEPFLTFIGDLSRRNIKFSLDNLVVVHDDIVSYGLEVIYSKDKQEYQKKYHKYLTLKKKSWCDISWEEYSLMTDNEIKEYKRSKILKK